MFKCISPVNTIGIDRCQIVRIADFSRTPVQRICTLVFFLAGKSAGKFKYRVKQVDTVITNDRNFVNASVTMRNYSFKYLDSSKQGYNINDKFIGYNYSFSL